jgi:hypothetical protein
MLYCIKVIKVKKRKNALNSLLALTSLQLGINALVGCRAEYAIFNKALLHRIVLMDSRGCINGLDLLQY